MKRKIKKKGRLNAVPLFVPEARLELACPFGRHPLKMVCLPVPPFGQINVSVGGLEPPTLCLKGRCSTPELHARTFSKPTRKTRACSVLSNNHKAIVKKINLHFAENFSGAKHSKTPFMLKSVCILFALLFALF
jgi:hypothetical protein